MTPKSEDEILNSIKELDNSDLLQKSIQYEFIKGVELALQNELIDNDINFIKDNIYYIKNKEIVRLLLDKIKDILTEDQLYIIEKYKLELHQDEEKEYERWFKKQLIDLEVSKSTENPSVLIYKKNGEVLYNYNEKSSWFDINYDKIWSIFNQKFHFNNNEIRFLTKGMVEEHLNLKGIKTFTLWGTF
jgi:hypothetical protein